MGSIADAVRADRAMKLERLGSDRGLLAVTDADLTDETVRERLAATDAAVAAVLDDWAAAADDPAASAFASAAETKREHVADLDADALDAPDPGADPIAATLSGIDGIDARFGAGLVGYPLVADGRYLQAVNLFVNEADETSADQFRTIRSETADLIDRGESMVDNAGATTTAALDVVDAAYEAYVDSLDALGIDPKTVC